MTIDLKSKLAGDKLYFISYGLFLVTSILSTSFFYKYFMGTPYMWLQIIGTAILVMYECQNGIQKQNWWGLAACLAMELIAWRISTSSTQRQVVLMFWYIYCARNISFAKIARFSLNVSIALVLLVVTCSCFGLVESITAFKSGRVREYLGFRYALYLPGLLLNMTALWVYLKKNTVTIWGCLVWAVANWVVYYFSDSRISFAIAEALLAAALFMRYCPKVTDKLKPIWWLAVGSFLICAVVSLILTVKYDSAIPWMRKLNSVLEGRLRLGHVSLLENGFYFFGQRITWLGNGLDGFGNSAVGTYTYVDCLYVKILQRYGTVFLVLMMVFCTWSMIRLYKRREYHVMLICATVAAHSVLDDLAFSLHYNTFWLAMGMVLMNVTTLNWDGKTTQIQPIEE